MVKLYEHSPRSDHAESEEGKSPDGSEPIFSSCRTRNLRPFPALMRSRVCTLSGEGVQGAQVCTMSSAAQYSTPDGLRTTNGQDLRLGRCRV
jgi:hypothetical protein